MEQLKPLTRILLIFACVLLLMVAGVGVLCCVMGMEAITTGINPVPWLMTLIFLVVLPLGAATGCVWLLLRKK